MTVPTFDAGVASKTTRSPLRQATSEVTRLGPAVGCSADGAGPQESASSATSARRLRLVPISACTFALHYRCATRSGQPHGRGEECCDGVLELAAVGGDVGLVARARAERDAEAARGDELVDVAEDVATRLSR